MPTQESRLQIARVVSVIAATTISLACGTNYAFSAWGPQFALRMHLSSTETNLVATFGNLGVYLCGIPIGIMTDKRGAKPGVLGGSVCVGFGYYMLHKAYDGGAGFVPLPLLCIFNFFTGLGSCAAFAGAIKTSAVNWPQHRGSATAFPLAAFGLSAFLFASLSRTFAPNDTTNFLMILSIGGFCLIFVPSFFLRVVPHSQKHSYRPIAGGEGGNRNKLQKVESADSRKRLLHNSSEPGASASSNSARQSGEHDTAGHEHGEGDDDCSSDDGDELDVTDEPVPADVEILESNVEISEYSAHRSIYADVRGAQMLKYTEFYHYFLLLGLLTGTGLMTINNIGSDAQALWNRWQPTMSLDEIRARQSVHVSLLSLCSFLGRLVSGIGSDVVVTRLELSRVWCLLGSALAFALAQVLGLTIVDPNLLALLSGLTGLAYGFLFGCFPSVVAETFGIAGLSTNWGVLTLAPVLFANVFNLMYGAVFDAHSPPGPDHHRDCADGRFCYHDAYWGTFVASVAAAGIALWSIWHQDQVKRRLARRGEGDGHLA